ncbi:hypothetical protein HPB50_005904 [Hyalomma asiaticum]|uniref:Uncharacterized protein n=1 Tax=Hyalomma asiaticum TaxID=266040 RepID=A0ACB7TD68_HYAAI|nr:hypothetical protein HPB50_005904 [Hyalomma asiaticum]
MAPKRPYSIASGSKHHKRSRGDVAKHQRGRREPAASTPRPARRRPCPPLDTPPSPTSTAETVPVSLPSEEDNTAVSSDQLEGSDTYQSSTDEDDIETVRYSSHDEGRFKTALDILESILAASDTDSSPGPSSPERGSPGRGPLNSTLVDGGVPIDMVPSPVASARAVPPEPRLRDVRDEPGTSGTRPLALPSGGPGGKQPAGVRGRPAALSTQDLACEASTSAGTGTPAQATNQAIPPCPLGLHRRKVLDEMQRYGVHFSGFLPRKKKK